MEKYFDLNKEACSIRCKLYCGDPRHIGSLVLYGHGFGGHRDNRAAERFARFALSKHRDAAVLCFDWPCHGSDGRKKLSLDDCETYLRLLVSYAREELGAERLLGYATSFGGYLFLKYIAENGCPFEKLALRCPAVDFYETFRAAVCSGEELEKLARGKDVLVGFDRKVKISPDFFESIRAADLRKYDFLPYCERLLILHGEKDEIVPIGPVCQFADDNLIEFIPVPNADHRFSDPGIMDRSISQIGAFLWSA